VLFRKVPAWAVATAGAACLFFIGIRYGWLGPRLTIQALGLQLDKWQIGPLRLLNLISFMVVVYWLRKYLLRLVAIEPFLTLGKASLRVFCAHIFFVFVGLALLYGDFNSDGLDQLHGPLAIALLAVTFTALLLVAWDEVRKKHGGRGPGGRQETNRTSPTPGAVLRSDVSADARPHAPVCCAFGEGATSIAPAVDRANIVQ
jgi:hypothetical protein